jgi:hypothetical protein
MTENTKVLGIRLENDKKERLAKYLNRESAEAMLRQIERGEIDLTLKGVVFKRVNKISESVNNLEYDPDGEWVREMAHVLNMDVRSFKKRIEQSIYR